MNLPTAEIVETVATREVDEVMQQIDAMGLREHLDEPTITLIRGVMIAAWERGAAYMANSLLLRRKN
ncbi:MAG TPA: hypothetical protein VF764_12525 [Steroidobacteraceae bacterium]